MPRVSNYRSDSHLSNREHQNYLRIKALSDSIANYTKYTKTGNSKERVERFADPANFEEFVKYYVDKTEENQVLAPFGWFQREAIRSLLIENKRRQIWEWSRGFGKSSFAAFYVPLWLWCYKQLEGAVICSSNQDKACDLSELFYLHLNANQRLHNDFGKPMIAGTPRLGKFTISLEDYRIKVWCFGLGQNPAGAKEGHSRPNLFIGDDMDTLRANTDQSQRIIKEHKAWIDGVCGGLANTLKDNFIQIIANNRVHPRGLTAHMVGDLDSEHTKDKSWHHIKAYLTEDPDTHEKLYIEEGGKPAWKEAMDIQQCKKVIERTGSEYKRQLYHETILEGEEFQYEWFKYADTELLPFHKLICYFDPAFGKKRNTCFTAGILMGLHNRKTYILDCTVTKTENPFKHATLFNKEMKQIYGNKIECYIESIMQQEKILVQMKRILSNDHPELDQYQPQFDNGRKTDKIDRIGSLKAGLSVGNILISKAIRHKRDWEIMLQQFLQYPNGDLDGPDAAQGAYAILMNHLADGIASTQTHQAVYLDNYQTALEGVEIGTYFNHQGL